MVTAVYCIDTNMQWRLLIIYFISILIIAYNDGSSYPKQISSAPLIQSINNKLETTFIKKHNARLLVAFVSGHKRSLNRKIKRMYKELCLYHLFTPSGIHLTALYSLIIPALILIRRRSKIGAHLLQLFLCLMLYFLPGFYSLKRISSLRIFQLATGKRLSLFSSFIIVFGLDFIFGTYTSNPLSFCYSFLFLGVIIATIGQNKLLLPIALTGAQMIVCYFQQTSISLLAPTIGFFLTFLFSPLFILFFISFWISYFSASLLFEYPIIIFQSLVAFFFNINSFFATFSINIPILIIIFVLLLPIAFKVKTILFVILAMIQSAPIKNLPKPTIIPSSYQSKWNWIDKSKILSIKRYYRGYQIQYESSYHCYYQHYNWFYKESCY